MLEHLLDETLFTPDVLNTPAATPVSKASPEQLLDAQVETAKWLEELGAVSDRSEEHTSELQSH